VGAMNKDIHRNIFIEILRCVSTLNFFASVLTSSSRPTRLGPDGPITVTFLPGGVRPARRGPHLPLPSSSDTLPPGSLGDRLRGISTVGRWIYLRCPRFLHKLQREQEMPVPAARSRLRTHCPGERDCCLDFCLYLPP